MSAPRGMGRGLAAILPESASSEAELRELPIDLVRPNPGQPRKRFDQESLAALAESIRATGVIQPLIVRPLPDGTYEIVAGERRWRAAREAGLEHVPAILREADDAARMKTALVENMVREDLNAIEEARACAALVEELDISKEQVARLIGRSRAAVSNLIRLLDLPEQVIELIQTGRLSEGHGRAVLQARDDATRRRLARDAASEGWSVRETERRARESGEAKQSARRSKVSPHPEKEAARARAEDALGAALGTEVRVRIDRTGVAAELLFADLTELLELAERLSSRRAA